jgi:hypothetical protein
MHSTGNDGKSNEQHQIQVKLSTIFKKKVIDVPQAFGSLYDSNGEKYCAISALSKYLGYDIASALKDIPNDKLIDPIEVIPSSILETIENFLLCCDPKKKLDCFCSRPNYYYSYSLISMLIHLNDYHKMTFPEIGNWLESKEM